MIETCPTILIYAFFCMEIHPCVLQDISPLGPLPCSQPTITANCTKQGKRIADHMLSLDYQLTFAHKRLMTATRISACSQRQPPRSGFLRPDLKSAQSNLHYHYANGREQSFVWMLEAYFFLLFIFPHFNAIFNC